MIKHDLEYKHLFPRLLPLLYLNPKIKRILFIFNTNQTYLCSYQNRCNAFIRLRKVTKS